MVKQTLIEAYRWQYILSGARHPYFASTLSSLTTGAQFDRIQDALSSLSPMQALAAA